KFDDFLKRLHSDKDEDKISEHSWFVDIKTIKEKNYDIKAINPNIKEKIIPKPDVLFAQIEESQSKIRDALKRLKEIK
ncbi:MAG: N-6 DNA methylase, partial [Candidatus Micrarchaeota archaeon]|nr:N-6 DNA methylase [Candidatus Micrarchaeota archaeon]